MHKYLNKSSTIIATAFLLMVYNLSCANDGAFYMNGNHLVPITENQVQLSKEVLTIREDGQMIFVDVDYTFYNPGTEKEVLLGFEAPLPNGGASMIDKGNLTREHPYIQDFTVEFNAKKMPFQSDIVESSAFQNKVMKFIDDSVFEAFKQQNYFDFYSLGPYIFVNYFQVKFKNGINKIHHTYSFQKSGSIDFPLKFEYILTAARRWANEQIDDFTLILDFQDYSEFYIDQTFFSGTENWIHDNTTTVKSLMYKDREEIDSDYSIYERKDCLEVRTKKDKLKFHTTNFKPQGELFIWKKQFAFFYIDLFNGISECFNSKEVQIDYEFYQYFNYIQDACDEKSLNILRNYPFARRGYAFKNKEIRKYYQSMGWYVVDPRYDGNYKDLYPHEKDWLEKLKLAE